MKTLRIQCMSSLSFIHLLGQYVRIRALNFQGTTCKNIVFPCLRKKYNFLKMLHYVIDRLKTLSSKLESTILYRKLSSATHNSRVEYRRLVAHMAWSPLSHFNKRDFSKLWKIGKQVRKYIPASVGRYGFVKFSIV
jgi:hypothetical protein